MVAGLLRIAMFSLLQRTAIFALGVKKIKAPFFFL
jgi:hypothetical protein